jgi:hypothetical protein
MSTACVYGVADDFVKTERRARPQHMATKRLTHGRVRQQHVRNGKAETSIHTFDDDPSYAYPKPDDDCETASSSSSRTPKRGGGGKATRQKILSSLHQQQQHQQQQQQQPLRPAPGAVNGTITAHANLAALFADDDVEVVVGAGVGGSLFSSANGRNSAAKIGIRCDLLNGGGRGSQSQVPAQRPNKTAASSSSSSQAIVVVGRFSTDANLSHHTPASSTLSSSTAATATATATAAAAAAAERQRILGIERRIQSQLRSNKHEQKRKFKMKRVLSERQLLLQAAAESEAAPGYQDPRPLGNPHGSNGDGNGDSGVDGFALSDDDTDAPFDVDDEVGAVAALDYPRSRSVSSLTVSSASCTESSMSPSSLSFFTDGGTPGGSFSFDAPCDDVQQRDGGGGGRDGCSDAPYRGTDVRAAKSSSASASRSSIPRQSKRTVASANRAKPRQVRASNSTSSSSPSSKPVPSTFGHAQRSFGHKRTSNGSAAKAARTAAAASTHVEIPHSHDTKSRRGTFRPYSMRDYKELAPVKELTGLGHAVTPELMAKQQQAAATRALAEQIAARNRAQLHDQKLKRRLHKQRRRGGGGGGGGDVGEADNSRGGGGFNGGERDDAAVAAAAEARRRRETVLEGDAERRRFEKERRERRRRRKEEVAVQASADVVAEAAADAEAASAVTGGRTRSKRGARGDMRAKRGKQYHSSGGNTNGGDTGVMLPPLTSAQRRQHEEDVAMVAAIRESLYR